MSTEEDNKDAGAEDPFAGWAEALEEQKRTDDKPESAEQGGPLSGESVRPFSAGGGGGGGDGTANDINMVLDIPVQLSVELGRTKVPIKYILQLAQGSVVELDALAGEPMDVLVNGYLIAQGEVVVVNDKFGIRLTDVVTPSERLRRVSRG
ncbi:flagellar motor switch protein FliN [Paracidovorax sp. MALMAid1276]|uniref:flagellar motor switch protein FliN n=1 Tax=Paracidovorax sp. MALMAid1276 TaxID=3411631 RepID=UPI003B990A52